MEPLVFYCEPKYDVSPYIYEFTNTLSNLPYLLVSFYIAFPENLFMFCIFFGSSLFHGFKPTFYTELMDEVPIILCVNSLIFKIRNKQRVKLYFYSLDTLIFYLYFKTKVYEIFLIYLIYKILIVIYYTPYSQLKLKAMFFLSVASLFWVIEQEYCKYNNRLYILHSFWHIFSALSYYTMYKAIN